ncbi:Cholesterol 7-alpha-monooxygenase [Metarhizium rileyi]|uniref:Cholesterol 7-alpha-monooxygenase n=1 Tax=Metarhizium rileyi (strain RCEF 4871) TaxID=1649241 RepID=A0A5C6G6H8_METRR|nr:Cholesterol 7-alpha-monooxygenase [Metarhizium rileyi]
MNNSQKLFREASNEPLQLILFGTRVYFISRVEDVSEAYRNTRTLTVDEFYQRIFLGMGTSKESVTHIFAPPSALHKNPENRLGKPVAQLARELQMAQLQPSPGLDALERAELDYLERHMQPDAVLASRHRYMDLLGGETPGRTASVELSLWNWCADLHVRAAQKAFFGDALDRLDPELPQKFLEFDDLGWKLLYQFPTFLARDAMEKRDCIRAILKAFYDLPREKRDEAAGWVLSSTEDELRAIGIPSEDIASVVLILYWGPSLIEPIRAETAAAFGPEGTITDLKHLHGHCHHLDAAWNETLRLTSVAASVRTVTADTVIGGRMLRAGHRLIIPYRQLHLDTGVFGHDVTAFRPDRFLNNKPKTGKRVRRGEYFRPFGGGSTICPGRFFTKRVVVIFVALLLRRFDISMAGGSQSLPQADEWRPVLGIADIKPGDDMRIRLTPRRL